MTERALVTGAAGFIGSHTVEALLARGDTVTGVDNFDPFYAEAVKRHNIKGALTSPNFELVEADIRDAAAMAKLIAERKPNVLVHLAARAGVLPHHTDPCGTCRTRNVPRPCLRPCAEPPAQTTLTVS